MSKVKRPILDRLPPADVVGWSIATGLAATALTVVAAYSVNYFSTSHDGDGYGPDSRGYIGNLAPAERVQHDYSGHDESGSNCLEPTGYDILDSGHNQLVHVGAVSVEGSIIVVKPGKPDAGEPDLRLVINDGSMPLQPADATSTAILAEHNCRVADYPQG